MRVLGIDPGARGGLALLTDTALETYAMPTATDGKHTVLDAQRLVWLLEQWRPDHAVLEIQHPMPKQGVTSTFSTGRGYGTLIGVLAALSIPTTFVRAREWQAVMLDAGTGDTGERSIATAARLWPLNDFRRTPRCRDPHDGLTDAALISAYGARVIAKVAA